VDKNLVRNSRNKVNMARTKIKTFAPIVVLVLATLKAVSLLLNGMLMMWKIQQAMQGDYAIHATRIHPTFIPVIRLQCSYHKISSLLIEIPFG